MKCIQYVQRPRILTYFSVDQWLCDPNSVYDKKPTHTRMQLSPPPPQLVYMRPLCSTHLSRWQRDDTSLFCVMLLPSERGENIHVVVMYINIHYSLPSFVCFFFFLPPPLGLTLSSKEEMLRRSSGSRCRGVLQVVTSGEGACLKELTLSNSRE